MSLGAYMCYKHINMKLALVKCKIYMWLVFKSFILYPCKTLPVFQRTLVLMASGYIEFVVTRLISVTLFLILLNYFLLLNVLNLHVYVLIMYLKLNML